MKKSTLLSVVAFMILLFFSGCKKTTDLTTQIVGKYQSGSGSAKVEITVNKVDDKTVSIAVEQASSASYAFTKVTMNSETAFTLNTITIPGRFCDGTETISGTGTVSGGNISLFYSVNSTSTSGSPYACTAGIESVVLSASK
ncbi:MAG: hypothetical protein U0T84_13765 [Chitinophagales bacterium]